jgi:hypothetical protein
LIVVDGALQKRNERREFIAAPVKFLKNDLAAGRNEAVPTSGGT